MRRWTGFRMISKRYMHAFAYLHRLGELVRAPLLQTFFGIRLKRQLMEPITYNIMFK